jgi:hypothetical protein
LVEIDRFGAKFEHAVPCHRGSGFKRVIGKVTGEPHSARGSEFTRPTQQGPGAACESGDLASRSPYGPTSGG